MTRRAVDARPVHVGDLVLPDVELGAVYVIRTTINDRFDGPIDLLHVMSKYAGGEIRGYKRAVDTTGPWLLRRPATPEGWPEVDAAVAALLGEEVKGA